MFYVKDLESLGGLFIREKVVKKGFNYEIMECLLYIMGEKFHVVLKEYKKGKGVVIEVLEYNNEEAYEQRQKLEDILERHAEKEHSFIKDNRRERAMIELKVNILKLTNFVVLIQSLVKLGMCNYHGQLFSRNGITACITTLIGLTLIVVINNLGKRYIRG